MENSTQTPIQAPFSPEVETVSPNSLPAVPEAQERYPNRFKPGQSGNPSGRSKRTQEELDGLEEIRKLAPGVAAKMKEMLAAPKVPAIAKVRILEIILWDRGTVFFVPPPPERKKVSRWTDGKKG